ncbi:MAG: FAD-dependent oxidoreductase [Xylophilus ampelinus]
MSLPLVVIGSGLSGWTTVREFRKLDAATPVVLVTLGGGDFYAKPTLSNAFAQKRAPEQLVTTPAAALAESLQVTLRAHTRVVGIDTAARTVALEGGETLAYRDLVLATGAHPVRVPLEGDAADRVRSVNSLDDYGLFHRELPAGATVVVMGAGLIGCEFANDLLSAGCRVHLVDPAPAPLSTLLPADAGAALAEALAAAGAVLHAGATVRAVDAAAAPSDGAAAAPALRVTLSDGTVLPADAVLSAIGLRAETALAEAAGIRCERGVCVDDLLRTSAPGVHALGDGAQYASAGGRLLPYVMPVMSAARALAATLAGTPTPVRFPVMPVTVKTPALPIVVAVPGPAHAEGGRWSRPEDGVWHFHGADGLLRGFVLAGKQTPRRMEQTKLLAS